MTHAQRLSYQRTYPLHEGDLERKEGIRVDKNMLCDCKRIVGSLSCIRCVRGRRSEEGEGRREEEG